MGRAKKLTTHDLAFGIGRKATDEELLELIRRPKTGKRTDGMDVLEDIKKNLAQKDTKKAS
ncbi:MAG TPA: hypothetical protein VG603_05495 [Chitinophagales bacterium]|nr:hypothetical protein [Chitinophagales bacterium]